MLFKTLAGLLAGNTALTILVTGSEDAMTVTVIPTPSKTGEGTTALATPMSLTHTAAELDEGFVELLGKFSASRKSLAEQYEVTDTVLEAAKKASAEKAVKGVTKTAKAATTKPETAAAKTPPGSDPENEDDDGNSGGGGDVDAPATAAPGAAPANLFA